MRIKHEKWIVGSGHQYYVDTFFAFLPNIINTGGAMPQPVWLCRYWQTYPVDAEGNPIEMYRETFGKDPRKAKK